MATGLVLVERPEIVVFDKVVKQARDVQFFSDIVKGYLYSGKISYSQPMPAWLSQLMSTINIHFGTKFNSALVNRYRNGEDCVGSHSDDERSLVYGSPIASLSLGASRTFRIREKSKMAPILADLLLNSGDFVMMQGNFQSEFKHEIPKEKKITQPRVSLTFREHKMLENL